MTAWRVIGRWTRSWPARPPRISRLAAQRRVLTGSDRLIVSDPTRGNVIQFTGTGQRVSAGSAIIPQMTLTNDFTWSFWANSAVGANNNIIVGNRFSPTAATELEPARVHQVHDEQI